MTSNQPFKFYPTANGIDASPIPPHIQKLIKQANALDDQRLELTKELNKALDIWMETNPNQPREYFNLNDPAVGPFAVFPRPCYGKSDLAKIEAGTLNRFTHARTTQTVRSMMRKLNVPSPVAIPKDIKHLIDKPAPKHSKPQFYDF